MIINSSLKTEIVHSFSKRKSNYDEYELLATEIIFYKYLTNFIANNPDQANAISTLVSSYVSDYLYKFTELKNKYTSYLAIIYFLKNNNYNNILNIREPDIEHVYNIYKNSKLIEDFNPDKFSLSVYGINNVDNNALPYLQNIHYNVLSPIIRYYMKLYNVPSSALKIVDSNSNEVNIGKRILFYIDGVPSSVIYSDIKGNKFPIKYYKLNIKFPNIEIINN